MSESRNCLQNTNNHTLVRVGGTGQRGGSSREQQGAATTAGRPILDQGGCKAGSWQQEEAAQATAKRKGSPKSLGCSQDGISLSLILSEGGRPQSSLAHHGFLGHQLLSREQEAMASVGP
jgi:hypothetical protein